MAVTEHPKISDPAQMADAFAQWQRLGLGALNWMGGPILERMGEISSEWLHFLSERVQEDVALQHELLQAKSASEIQEIQMAFVQRAIDQYRAETGKMMSLGIRMFEADDDAKDA